MLREDVKKRIISEYGSYFNESQREEVVDLYEKVIDIEIEHESVKGLSKSLACSLEHFFQNGFSGNLSEEEMNMVVNSFINMEPFLKKVLCLKDKPLYESLYNQGDVSCGKLLDQLNVVDGLKKSNGYINFGEDPNKFRGNNNQLEHILKAYKIRNTSAHEARAWTMIEKFTNVQSVIVTSLYVCWKQRDAIRRAYNSAEKKVQLDVGNYIKEIIKSYEKNIKEGFKFIPIKWQKKKVDSLYGESKAAEKGKDKIEMTSLKAGLGKANRLLLLGEAGCGKTTSLQYLEYLDAKKWMQNNDSPVPVMIKLIDATVEWFSLEDYICKILNIPLEYCLKMLDAGELNVYLDGVNEMIGSRDVKRKVVMQIEKFLVKYPKTFVAITDRENTEITIDIDMLTYYLHSMESDDIKAYICQKETFDEKTLAEILEYAESMVEQGISFTPIMLNFLLWYVKRNDELPETSTEFIQHFIYSLIERELKEKKDINAAPGRLDSLLMYLAVMGDEDGQLSDIQVLKIFADCNKILGQIDIDTKQCLNLALQLGILEMRENNCWFANRDYYECFFAKALDKGMDEWDA